MADKVIAPNVIRSKIICGRVKQFQCSLIVSLVKSMMVWCGCSEGWSVFMVAVVLSIMSFCSFGATDTVLPTLFVAFIGLLSDTAFNSDFNVLRSFLGVQLLVIASQDGIVFSSDPSEFFYSTCVTLFGNCLGELVVSGIARMDVVDDEEVANVTGALSVDAA